MNILTRSAYRGKLSRLLSLPSVIKVSSCLNRTCDGVRNYTKPVTLRAVCIFKHPGGLFHVQRRTLWNRNLIKPGKHFKGDIRKLLQQAKPEHLKLSFAILLLFISSTVTIAFPFCIGKVIDIIYTSSSPEEMKNNLNFVCKVLASAVVVGGLANFGRVYLINVSALRIINRVRQLAHTSILRQEITFFDKSRTGELINRLSNDASVIGSSLTQNISDGLRSTIAIIGGIGMMVYTSPHLSLVGLSVVPPVALFAVLYGQKLRNIATSVQSQLAEATALTEEQFSNIRTVRAFAKEPFESEMYSKKLHSLFMTAKRETLYKSVFFGVSGSSGNLIILSVLYYGGLLMTEGHITVGSLSSFLLYAAYVGISIGGLGSFFTETMKALGSSARLWEIIEKEPTIPLRGGLSLENLVGRISFNNVTFNYPLRPDVCIFSNLNLAIPEGTVMAVVGTSGSGKSTLASLLMRFYDPIKGHIAVDDVNVKDLDPSFLRTCVGIVSQEPILFSTSILENILYGSINPESVELNEIITAAKEANAWDFICSFPEKLDTIVGEKGVTLSGGQRQRVAIARAILKNPRILVLDEATSSLDSVSEHAVQEALERVMQGRTVLTIAHRLSTIKNAHQIAVLHKGTVAELGSYEELIRIPGGLFKKLVEHQSLSG